MFERGKLEVRLKILFPRKMSILSKTSASGDNKPNWTNL